MPGIFPICFGLFHKEAFATKKEAMGREKQLKSARGRDWIRKNILNQ